MAEAAATPERSAEEEIRGLIERSRAAQKQIEHYTQEQVDALIRATSAPGDSQRKRTPRRWGP